MSYTAAIQEQPAFTWSPYQTGIFQFVESGEGNGIVISVAGSGKTTVLVEASKYAKGTSMMLAFNKAIAEELKLRGVNAKTFHSLCYTPVMKFKGTKSATLDKSDQLLKANLSSDDYYLYGRFAKTLVSLAKQVGIGCLVPNDLCVWQDIVTVHDLEPSNTDAKIDVGIDYARKLLAWSEESSMFDFDDMLYCVVKHNLTLPTFDFVFVDEAQDTNAIQRKIIKKTMHKNSRMVAVGDPAQSIYGFRGADSDSMSLIERDFKCTQLPLTVSYRCPINVVKYAQQWVDYMEHSDTAIDGSVNIIDHEWSINTFKPNDFIVCRTSKPLVTLAFQMMRARIPVFIMGRDIGEGLKSTILKMKAFTLADLKTNIETWREEKSKKAIEDKREYKLEYINDTANIIIDLSNGLSEQDNVQTLVQIIDTMFTETSKDSIKMGTIHKAKGLEAKHVYWLNYHKVSKYAVQKWQIQQEDNLCYVAATRALKNLTLIKEKEEG